MYGHLKLYLSDGNIGYCTVDVKDESELKTRVEEISMFDEVEKVILEEVS